MKKLILIDRKFPFMTGETFLENEINEIAKNFDKIYIFPLDASLNDLKTRKISAKNVEVIVTGKKNYNSNKKKYFLNSLKYIFSKKNEGKTLKQKAYEGYYLSICAIKTKEILKKFDDINFDESDEIYIYAYWLYTPASISINIKNYFENKNYKCIAISRAHRFDIYLNNTRMKYLPQRNYLVSNLDMIFPCSKDGNEYLKKQFANSKNIFFEGYLGTYDYGLKEYSKHKSFNIISCSRLSEVKRVNLIIDTLKELKNEKIDITWTHIGGGELFEQLKLKAENELLGMDYKFIGNVNNAQVYEYYLQNNVDLFINVSSSEGLPVSIMEAISFGIPIIATDVGGTSEIVKDGISGYLIKENFEINELKNCILKIYNLKTDEYKSLRNRTRNFWKNNFQAKINYSKFSNEIINEMKRKYEKKEYN